MRILHVLEAVEGGTALHVRHLAAAQVPRHTVAVAVPDRRSWGRTDDRLATELREAGIDVRTVGMRRNPAHPANVAAALSLRRLVRAWKPDVVHAHSTVGVLGRLVARVAGVPVVHTQNGATFAAPDGGASAIVGRAIEVLLRRFTDASIAVSDSEAAELRRHHRRGVVVVPNGIPTRDEPVPAFPDPPVVVCVSRFVHQKEPLLAVRVMAAARRLVPAARALLIGYGDQEAAVRRLVDELDPGIEIRGDVRGADAVGGASVVLLSSRFEGAPYVLLEAMERGRPVVATDVVGSRDAVVHGETGFLFPFGDVAAGATLVARLLEDPTLTAAVGAAGRRRLQDEFTVELMAARVDDVYEAVVAGSSRRR